MNLLSLEYVLFSLGASFFSWIFHHKTRKYLVLAANLIFLLLISSAVVNGIYVLALCAYVYGVQMILSKKEDRKTLILLCLVPVLGLAWFKYAGFFTGTSILLPLGISFYTFRAISFLAEVHKKAVPVQDPVSLIDYICFFPFFMAGPIHRPQPFFDALNAPFVFDYRKQKNGFIQMCLGLFEKLVIADFLKNMTDQFYRPELSGIYTVLAVILYAFYIYADFDAYSNTALGIAKMMGFESERNFHAPYCSSSLMEFWKRWHISLSSWLRDYIYIPLGGSRKGKARKYLNILIVFLASGLWHGNTLMFLIWGLGHGILNILENIIASVFRDKSWVRVLKPLLVILNFVIVALLWVPFQSPSMADTISVFSRLSFSNLASFDPKAAGIVMNEWYLCLAALLVLVITDMLRYRWDMLEVLADRFILLRWVFYALLIAIAIVFGVYGPGYHPEDFIYVTF